jgi:adenylate cyclase
VRPWYKQAKQSKKSIWTDVYVFYPDQGLGISTATPVLAPDGHVRGVFGFDVSLENLKQFVEEQRVSPNGYSFIITRNENLIAYPQRPPFTMVSAPHDKLINVHQIGLPFIDKSIDTYKKTGQQALVIDYQNNTYLITYRPVSELMPQGWLIGVVTPRSDLIGFLTKMNIITILVSLGILFIGIIIVSNLVSRIVRPINLLVRETDKIRQFELDGGDVKISSRIKEVIYIRNAIRAMKRGLKQFQMFVPRTLVRQLIESGQEIGVGGERKQLVVLFSDIQNFTTIAERMDANALMEHICEYFELLSQIIIQDNGTIDKYIGDSVMAFWGAPIAEPEPWYHAAHAALKIQERMRELNARWEKHGKPRLVTRIGIHMGEAIVGNLGSSERLNYTAIGDTVNITSRLEHINKTYKTKIIVSEAVYQLIKDKFVLRLVDTVVIKGRTETISVYELLGDDRSKIGFDIDAYAAAYERGFVAYKLKEWDKAISYFKECLQIYPEDKLALVFIRRCELRAHHDTE